MIPDSTNESFPETKKARDESDLLDGQTSDEHSAHLSGGYQPIIGIPILVSQGKQGPLLLADAVGAWAVEQMKGRVFFIPLWPFPLHTQVFQALWPVLQSMDGLFLPAGLQGMTDWSRIWCDHHPGPQTWALSWEIALAQLASYIGMPILAIADGAEKWNVALGGKCGTLEVSTESSASPSPENWPRHEIRVRAQSKLAESLQQALRSTDGEPKPWELAFMPHQGVEKVAPGLRSCAQTEETELVAFERKDSAFGLGILGRIDWELDQIYGRTLFETFLRACQSFDLARQQHDGWESSRDGICATVSELVRRNQPLIPLSQQDIEKEEHNSQNIRLSDVPLSASRKHQEQGRLAAHTLTKEELNKLRRKRLKKRSGQ